MIIRDPRCSVKRVPQTTDSEGDGSSEVIVDGTREEGDGSERPIERDAGIILYGRIKLSSTTETNQRIVLRNRVSMICRFADYVPCQDTRSKQSR